MGKLESRLGDWRLGKSNILPHLGRFFITNIRGGEGGGGGCGGKKRGGGGVGGGGGGNMK